MDGTILVADDDRTIRTVLTQALTRAGCKVHATSSLVTLMRWVEEGKGDLVISDVVMPDGNGLDMLPRISQERPGLPVIVISAQNTIMTAIQAAEAEAYDYLPKPFDLPDLMKRAARALEEKRIVAPPGPGSDAPDDLPLVGRTPRMQALYRLVARVMNTDLPVLVTGESGTGKSLIARAIHDYLRPPLAAVHRRLAEALAKARRAGGAARGARGGTILFDEIGDLDPHGAGARGADARRGGRGRAADDGHRAARPDAPARRRGARRLPVGPLLPHRGRAARRARAARARGRHPAARAAFPRPRGPRRRDASAALGRGDGRGADASLAR